MSSVVAVSALVCLAIVMLAPKLGLIARWRQVCAHTRRVRHEDTLKLMLKQEANGITTTIESVAGTLNLSPSNTARVLEDMESKGLISHQGGQLSLRPVGRDIALHVVRAHRLWESYLADQTGVPQEQWHSQADKQEHFLSKEEADALSAQLGHPTLDPHGDVIPELSGKLEPDKGRSLNTVELNVPFRISHIEDEPRTVYAQLVAQGLHPGMNITVSEKSPERIRFQADGEDQVLAPLFANNVTVAPVPIGESTESAGGMTLADLNIGESARIGGLSPACRGAERRRLLDLGFVPGTRVSVELVGPGGNPVAYRVRGTVVALRREQARLIRLAALSEFDGSTKLPESKTAFR